MKDSLLQVSYRIFIYFNSEMIFDFSFATASSSGSEGLLFYTLSSTFS